MIKKKISSWIVLGGLSSGWLYHLGGCFIRGGCFIWGGCFIRIRYCWDTVTISLDIAATEWLVWTKNIKKKTAAETQKTKIQKNKIKTLILEDNEKPINSLKY